MRNSFLFFFAMIFVTTTFGQMALGKTTIEINSNLADRNEIRANINTKLKKSFNKDATGNFQVVDFDIFFQDDSALVCYTAQGNKSNSAIYRMLDVYGKREGKWVEVSSNMAQSQSALISISPEARSIILKAREKVWRAWFGNEKATLEKAIPKEIIAINTAQGDLTHFSDVMESSEKFVKSGSKLVKLEYPKDEIQVYGSVIILYTTFLFEIESNGVRRATAGRATDMFIIRDGNFVNVGWHLDSGK